MTDGRAGIHERILEDLLDGVMVVQLGGTITVINSAAGRILDLTPRKAVGQSFAELFIAREGFEEFTDVILSALAGEREAGRRTMVTVRAGEEVRLVSVATSYLRSSGRNARAPVASISVFSDITELEELRETELRMAKVAEAQHAELQSAYLQIEERNETLATMLKKVQVARILTTMLVVGVFLGAGTYVWQPLGLFDTSSGLALASENKYEDGAVEDFETVIVEPRPIQETISLPGSLSPWRTVAVTSPLESRIAAVHFQNGEMVAEGDLLLVLDTAETVRKHRTAQVAHIEKQRAFETVKDWENSPEMAGARRSFARARMELESQENRLKRTAFLLDQGLIATAEHEDTERQYQSQLLNFGAAKEDLASARARGGKEALDKAALELQSAREELEEIAETLKMGRIHAPLMGIALPPARSDDTPEVGKPVAKGEALLTIGDFGRMAAKATLDEVDVVRIEIGQAVLVTGNAFPGIQLRGAVTHISSQPVRRSRGAPAFEVVVTLDPLEQPQRSLLRAGMSCRLQIVVYQKSAALVVPIEAVEHRGGKHLVRVIDRTTREATEREVQVGPTTQDSVEVSAGLRAGEEVVVPR